MDKNSYVGNILYTPVMWVFLPPNSTYSQSFSSEPLELNTKIITTHCKHGSESFPEAWPQNLHHN